MSYQLRRIDYFYTTIPDQPGEAYKLLSTMAERGINMLAFAAIPFGPNRTQLTLFPDDTLNFQSEAKLVQMDIDGPHPAFLVQGDDELGALASVHKRLTDAQINVYASTGVTDGKGDYGYVIYIKPEDYEKASALFEV